MSVPPSKHIYFFLFCCLSANILLARTDSYRCMWRDDPATTMTVGWNQLSGQALMLYYDVVDHGTNTAAYAHAHEPDRVVSYRNMNNHFVRLEGLQPATIYYFVIEDTDGVSKRFSFQTASDNPYAPLSIVAGGDSRNHRSSRQNANRLVSKLRPHVVFFGGDMTGGDTGKEWIDWMQDWQLTITKDGRLTPIIAARGNHEASNKTIVNLFDVPTAGVYFGLNFHGDLLRAYTLNSLIATGGAQRDWLKEDLHNSMHTRWRMAQYHYPTRPHTRVKRDRDNQMQNWSTLFHEHQVRLVVECDGHVVKTTYPVRPSTGSGSEQGFVRDDEQGTVYIGEGCWGAPLRRNNDDKHWTRNSGSFNQFKWIFVHYDYIEARTIKTDNADQVAAVDPNNIFSIPNGLNVWNPSNGDVVTIPWREQQATLASNRNWTSRSPFEVVNFETEMIGGDVYIQWTARNENSSTSYEIQRSLDGQSFTTIASIRPQLKALRENIYKLTDRNQTSEGALSYRLKSVNASGNITYLKPSHKITISHKDWEGASEILPDPNTGLLKIKYKLEQPGNVTIRMVNLDQKEISNSQYIDQRVGNHHSTPDSGTPRPLHF